MKKRGFSLIELMGVIILLSLISLLVIPSIDTAIKEFKKNAYESQISTIRLAAKDWAIDNLGLYTLEDDDSIQITLGQLKMGGYIKNDFINPNTQNPFPDDMLINITRVGESLKYDVLEETGVLTGTYENAPKILMNGAYVERINIGGTYTEKGVTATTFEGVQIIGASIQANITKDGVTVASINTADVANYLIAYTVTDNSTSLSRTIYRQVKVVDLVNPTISLIGEQIVQVSLGDSYIEQGAMADDYIDGDITDDIVITSNVDTNTIGIYNVYYNVTDSEGHKAKRVTRQVSVAYKDNGMPTVLFGTNGSIPYVSNSSTTVTVSDAETGVNASSLKYQWTQSTTAPAIGNFVNTFTNGSTITTPALADGTYYLWIYATDMGANIAILRSEGFNLDNSGPLVVFGNNGSVSYVALTSTVVTVSDTGYGVNAGSLEYQWTTNTTQPSEASFVTSFSSGGTITTPVSSTGTYYLWILAKDNNGFTTIVRSNVFNLDNENPTVAFGNNGSTPYVTSSSTSVTVSDSKSGVNAGSLEYQWTTSTTAPSEASFSTSFSNGGTISTPANQNGAYYLWILGKDNNGNTMILRSNVFNLDNAAPVISFGTNGNVNYAKIASTTVTVTDAGFGVNASSLRYLWTTSSTQPSDASFTTTFTSGAVVTSPTGLNVAHYLWITAKDTNGFTSYLRSAAFNLDNTNPVISVTGANPYTYNIGSFVEPGVSATDNTGATPTITNSGIPATEGSHVITYTATDQAGNTATGTRNVTAVRPWVLTNGSIAVGSGTSASFWGGSWDSAVSSTTIKPTILYYNIAGNFQDDPWGFCEIWIYGIRPDNSTVQLYYYRNTLGKTWTRNGTVALDGTVIYKQLRLVVTNKTWVTSSSFYFSQWYQQ